MKNFTLKTLRKKAAYACLSVFALGGLSATATAQTTTETFATETGTAEWLPIYGLRTYSYSQQLYYPANFPNAAGHSSLITKIRFYYVSGNSAVNDDWTVYLGTTSQNVFTSSSTSWIPTSQMTQAFSGTVTFPAANNWLEITLATPFVWDGVSNLVVGVDENKPGSGATLFQKTEVGSGRAIYYGSASTNPNPASPPFPTGTHGHVPNLQLELLPFSPCAGTPAHYSAIVNEPVVCAQETVTLNVNDNGYLLASTGLTYQWESNDGSGWEAIADATTKAYTTDELPAGNTQFRLVTTCTATTDTDISDAVTVTANALPNVSVNLANYAICPGGSAALIASGADTYSWSPATGLDNSNTNMVAASPAATTVYTVTGTSSLTGCTNKATSKIYPVASVMGSSAFTPAENCTFGTPVTINVTNVPAGISGSGSWEYRFLANDGVTVVQDWSATSSYVFTPGADSLYNFFYQLRSTSCQSTEIDSVKVTIPVGFGGETALIHYDCNTLGGTVTLSNTFGQTEITEIYGNTLSDPTNVANITFTGSAGIVDGRAQITPSAISNANSSMTILTPGLTLGANNSMNVSFKLTADQPITPFGTGGADGLSYSFGDDAVYSTGNLNNGKGTKLRLVFDANDNSPNMAGIYLAYGYTGTTAITPSSTGVLAYVNNLSSWKIKMDTPVELSISAEGKATLTVDGTVIFSGIQMPAAYMNADVSNWKHFFGAQTGGDAMRHAVSDFSITAGSLNYGITAGTGNALPTTWQTGKVFTGLAPGIYNVWLTKNTSGACNRKIETIEILNLNPVVDLGNDTTICEGETLTLDAGNAGATYVWSGTNIVTQTLEISAAGSYIVYATDTSGCLGIGTINVAVAEDPTASGIYVQGDYPTVFFAVTNPQNVNNYSWNFGDGTTAANAPSGVSHTYTEDGQYTVTATITNDCGTHTLTQNITIHNTASIAENTIEGLKVYPNPASDMVTISLEGNQEASATIYSVSGSELYKTSLFQSQVQINVQNWEKGVYFVQVTAEGRTSVSRIVVQ